MRTITIIIGEDLKIATTITINLGIIDLILIVMLNMTTENTEITMGHVVVVECATQEIAILESLLAEEITVNFEATNENSISVIPATPVVILVKCEVVEGTCFRSHQELSLVEETDFIRISIDQYALTNVIQASMATHLHGEIVHQL